MNYGLIQHWFSFLFSFTQGLVSVILNIWHCKKWTTVVEMWGKIKSQIYWDHLNKCAGAIFYFYRQTIDLTDFKEYLLLNLTNYWYIKNDSENIMPWWPRQYYYLTYYKTTRSVTLSLTLTARFLCRFLSLSFSPPTIRTFSCFHLCSVCKW